MNSICNWTVELSIFQMKMEKRLKCFIWLFWSWFKIENETKWLKKYIIELSHRRISILCDALSFFLFCSALCILFVCLISFDYFSFAKIVASTPIYHFKSIKMGLVHILAANVCVCVNFIHSGMKIKQMNFIH